MDVRIDQPGKQRAIAQVDHLRTSRMLDRRSDLDDAFALHQDFSRRNHATSFNVQQARRVQHNRTGWRSLDLACGVHGDGQKQYRVAES